jgi:phenylpropionate dioxygenase-like ring-hydroxylating dioxygenase large terminal subunit
MQALGPMKWLEPVNWKTLVDNCSDNYHVPTSHLSSLLVQSRYLGRPQLSHEEQFQSPNKHVFVNGHSLTFREVDDNTPRYVHSIGISIYGLPGGPCGVRVRWRKDSPRWRPLTG